VGAGSDADIVAVAPVDEVVPALLAGPGVVRDLVGRQARRRQHLPCRLEQGRAEVLVGYHQLALGVPGGERRAGLDRELVDREVPDRVIERAPQLGRPIGDGLVRPGVDQVEADSVEMPVRRPDGIECLGDVVSPAEKGEVAIVQRLDAERDAVHPGVGEGGEAPGLDAGRVGLERDLHVRRHGPMPADLLEHGGGGLGRHQGRRAAAEEHAGDRPPGNQPGRMTDLGGEGPAPGGVVDPSGDMAVEVAIGAFRQAERPVDVDAEAAPARLFSPVLSLGPAPVLADVGHGPQPWEKTRAVSSEKAIARWLTLCFQAWSTSPKVRSWPSGTNIGS
jgi:hypothetical protein